MPEMATDVAETDEELLTFEVSDDALASGLLANYSMQASACESTGEQRLDNPQSGMGK